MMRIAKGKKNKDKDKDGNPAPTPGQAHPPETISSDGHNEGNYLGIGCAVG